MDVERELVSDPTEVIELSLMVCDTSVSSLAGDLTMTWSFDTNLSL